MTTAEEYYTKGNELREYGQYEEAIEYYTKAIKLDPDYADAYYNRGNSYRKLQEYDEAIKDYTKAIRLDPDYGPFYGNRANCYEKTGDNKSAVDDYKKAIEKTDKNDEDYQEYKERLAELEKLISAPVNIKDCTEKELSALDGFWEERVEKFMKAREDGIMWYDIDSFAKYFNLQPHEIKKIEKRLIFPLRPVNRYGRKLDL